MGEIAVRLTVGARPGQIRKKFLGEGLWLTAVGMGIGLPVSLFVLRLLRSVPDFLPEFDMPPVVAVTVITVLGVGLVATWLPAARGSRVNPTLVLRQD